MAGPGTLTRQIQSVLGDLPTVVPGAQHRLGGLVMALTHQIQAEPVQAEPVQAEPVQAEPVQAVVHGG